MFQNYIVPSCFRDFSILVPGCGPLWSAAHGLSCTVLHMHSASAQPTQPRSSASDVGLGGSGGSSVPCVLRVAGSNPTPTIINEPYSSLSLTVACSSST